MGLSQFQRTGSFCNSHMCYYANRQAILIFNFCDSPFKRTGCLSYESEILLNLWKRWKEIPASHVKDIFFYLGSTERFAYLEVYGLGQRNHTFQHSCNNLPCHSKTCFIKVGKLVEQINEYYKCMCNM